MEYRAFECQLFTVGGGFDQYKILKVKCPGICPGRGCYTFVLIGALVSLRFKLTNILIQTLPFRKGQSVLFMFLSEIVSRVNKQDKPDL